MPGKLGASLPDEQRRLFVLRRSRIEWCFWSVNCSGGTRSPAGGWVFSFRISRRKCFNLMSSRAPDITRKTKQNKTEKKTDKENNLTERGCEDDGDAWYYHLLDFYIILRSDFWNFVVCECVLHKIGLKSGGVLWFVGHLARSRFILFSSSFLAGFISYTPATTQILQPTVDSI